MSYFDSVFAQELKLDSHLINDIVQGHKFLEQSLKCLTGKITWVDNTPTQTLSSPPQTRIFLFYNNKDSLRLEYIEPHELTQVLPGHKGNDITNVIICAPDYDFNYLAVATTGVPYANLFKSKSPDELLRMRAQTDYHKNINSLISLPGVKVTDLLQREIGKIEKCKYDNISHALLIEGKKDVSKTGAIGNWKIILNPEQHYALMYHEVSVNDKSKNFSLITSGKIISQKIGNNKILPKKIINESQVNERQIKKNIEIEITSTNKPDEFLFKENSLKELGRDYVVVDVLPNQKQADGGTIVEAAPLAARMPDYLIDKNPRSAWSWYRIILILSGLILITIACIRMFLNKKTR
jgi:hypothetical protein